MSVQISRKNAVQVSKGEIVKLYRYTLKTYETEYAYTLNVQTVEEECDDVWILRTEEEIQTLRDRDHKNGRWHDDGGEPILYGKYDGWPADLRMITVKVSSLRPEWQGYGSRPKFLRGGWCLELEREVLFRQGSVD